MYYTVTWKIKGKIPSMGSFYPIYAIFDRQVVFLSLFLRYINQTFEKLL